MRNKGFFMGRRKQSTNFFIKRVLLYSVLAAVLLYFVFYSGMFSTKEIEINPEDELYSNILSQASKFFGSNIFFLDSSEIEMTIKKSFPQIYSVEVLKILPNKIKINFSYREPLYSYCKSDKCYFIDKEGVLFLNDINKEGVANLPQIFIEEQDGIDVLPGEVVIKEKEIGMISKTLDFFKGSKVPISKIMIDKESFYVYSGNSYFAFTFEEDIDWQISKLKAALPKVKEDGGFNEYIDLRFGDKVYYR